MNLFSKIYSSLLVGIIVLLVLVGNWHFETEIKRFETEFTAHGQEMAAVIAQIVATTWGERGQEAALQQMAAAVPGDARFSLNWLGSSEDMERFPEAVRQQLFASRGQENSRQRVISCDEPGNRSRHFLVPLAYFGGGAEGVLQFSRPLSPVAEFAQQALLQSLSVTAILALVGAAVTYWLIYSKIRRPLERLSSKAIEIGKGNLSADLVIKGDDELVHLAGIMNDMCTRLLIAQEKIHFENLARLKTLEQLRHTEKLSTIGQIAAGIAHEIGTPLNVVDGRAKMILGEPLMREEILACARIIKNQAEKMTAIIRQLLDFSRKKRTACKDWENVVILVRQVFHLLTPLASKQGVALHLKTAPDLRALCCIDGQQIQQVLTNVIMNGIQATVGGGNVLVELSNIRIKSQMRTEDEPRDFLRIDIRDEGAGIDEALFEEIFTPFFTTKSVGLGTGLGLSIARELLEEHRGWIEVRNRPMGGAEFSLYLSVQEKDHEGSYPYN